MKKFAIIIGSASYKNQNINNLSGTKKDVENISNVFFDSDLGGYDKTKSKVLISPSLSEVRRNLEEVLFSGENIDVFAFYFSGHGGLKNNSYYLLLNESNSAKLSSTALPIVEVFNLIKEAKPKQSNIIIDACEASGVVEDLSTILKPEILGNLDTQSITLFLSSAANQSSYEVGEGGLATNELIKYLRGDLINQTTKPFLDLAEIGPFVSEDLKKKKSFKRQTPVCWALNLNGFSYFSTNPHFHQAGTLPSTFTLSQLPPSSEIERILSGKTENIWALYLNANKEFDPGEFLNSLREILSLFKGKKGSKKLISSLILGLSQTFASRAALSDDPFRQAEIYGCFCAVLLPYAENSKEVDFAVRNIAESCLIAYSRALEKLVFEISKEKFSLLSRLGGISDLYYLPLRIAKILGWSAGLTIIAKQFENGGDITYSEKLFSLLKKLTLVLSKHYSKLFVGVSDQQVPYFYLFKKVYQGGQLQDFVNEVFVSLTDDFFQNEGRLGKPYLNGKEVFQYLKARSTNNFSDIGGVISHPSIFFPMLLNFASETNQKDWIDCRLHVLDFYSFNIYIPGEWSEFSQEIMREGINFTFRVGSETGFGVFSVDDFENVFQKFCVPKIKNIQNDTEKICSICSCLVLPDRIPWFLEK